VLEVVRAAERVAGRTVPIECAPRRAGDPARLVADSGLFRQQLGWRPRYPEIDVIVRHAWQFEQGRPG
jgi:UDP-glucose 4-epimerase